MSTTSTDDDSSTDTTTVTPDCGHTVAPGDTFHIGEVRVCEECYLDDDSQWFGLEDYPDVLESTKYTAIEARGASTVCNAARLVGITADRRALYHDEDTNELWFVAPLHSEFHDTDTPVKAPLRDQHRDCTRGAPPQFGSPDFHTAPNGDHLALVETEEIRSLSSWLPENDDNLRAVHDRYAQLTRR